MQDQYSCTGPDGIRLEIASRQAPVDKVLSKLLAWRLRVCGSAAARSSQASYLSPLSETRSRHGADCNAQVITCLARCWTRDQMDTLSFRSRCPDATGLCFGGNTELGVLVQYKLRSQRYGTLCGLFSATGSSPRTKGLKLSSDQIPTLPGLSVFWCCGKLVSVPMRYFSGSLRCLFLSILRTQSTKKISGRPQYEVNSMPKSIVYSFAESSILLNQTDDFDAYYQGPTPKSRLACATSREAVSNQFLCHQSRTRSTASNRNNCLFNRHTHLTTHHHCGWGDTIR
ncbi:uncharacterized protein B0T15DRAFT_96149 [Chaetomium strumarium]|uniref:Uncharacterized protein n=1 Tax=Chaetomium strumarium TaxID=1170767 RepID=A0AAJ0M451_9PEZI|nr:hypothetical protein B0T15DRAFT_96149 [Chaetomium strumarium]